MQHTTYTIRPLTEQDRQATESLDSLSGNRLADMLDSPDYAWGAFIDNELIGYCSFGGADEYGDPDGYVLSDVYVRYAYRNRGVATQLIREVLCQQEASAKVFLTVLDDDLRTFYERFGFTYLQNGVMVCDTPPEAVSQKLRQIKLEVDPQENFTAANLMYRYGTTTPGVRFAKGYFGDARLHIDGRWYAYDHWSVTNENGKTIVTLYLEVRPLFQAAM